MTAADSPVGTANSRVPYIIVLRRISRAFQMFLLRGRVVAKLLARGRVVWCQLWAGERSHRALEFIYVENRLDVGTLVTNQLKLHVACSFWESRHLGL